MSARIETPAAAKAFLFAGKAVFTLKSLKSGDHITFKIKKPRTALETGPSHFVSVLDHADGMGGYSYLGAIKSGRLDVGRRSAYYGNTAAPAVTGLSWLLGQLDRPSLNPSCELWHEGKCGRCGRALTDPTSIATGIGPECVKKMKG